MPIGLVMFSLEHWETCQSRIRRLPLKPTLKITLPTKFDAAISLSSNNLITENNAFSIRGINPDFDTGQKLDGMNFRSRAKDLPLEHLERVEILKGAGGFLYGFGAPGGIINYVLKRPTEEFEASVSTQIMDSGLLMAHGDVGGRVGPDDIFGYRVNVVSEAGDTYVDDSEAYRKSASGSRLDSL